MKKKLLALVAVIALGALGTACRRKPLPANNGDAPPPTTTNAEAPAAPEQPTLVEVAPPPPPPPPPAAPATGHVPTSDEVRAKLQPLFPAVARCISQAGSVRTDERYLILRFGISSSSGTPLNAELQGHEEARACTDEVLRQIHFEPWNGPPSIITLPLTHSGDPVPESAFGDAGSR